MKRKAILLAALTLALAIPASVPSAAFAAESSATAAAGTLIDPVADAAAGGKVTIGGTTNASEVIVKVLNPDDTVLFFDIAAASGGRYEVTFTMPSDTTAGGTYRIIAGKGSDVSTRTFAAVSGSTGPSVPVDPGQPTTPTNPSVIQVKLGLSDVSAPVNGSATLDASKTKAAELDIRFPPAVGRTIGDSSLRILLPEGAVTLPQAVLSALADLAGSDAEASITLKVKTLTDSEAAALLNKAGTAASGLTPQGPVVQISLGIAFKDGTEKTLSTFAKPIQLQLQLPADADFRLAGIYYVADNGAVDYIGGTVKDRTISADVSHFSSYGVFAYTKAFSDVPASYWASGIIRELTAKHIVQGISADKFGPKANVTRAEFAAMLARALELKASSAAPFNDVKAGSWYAEDVAAAAENGIVTGTGNGKFEPGKAITREQMAIMIVRLYEKRSGGSAAGSSSDLAAFKDAKSISAWAKEDVQNAIHAGLMSGSGDGRFAPRDNAIRAEAAKVLYNLLFGVK
ncbi:S-layer homology domain-containing protein [Paenibacillus sacheonensis]|uniref:SLH domain-containing protein n=1 Tax=Paenibacillus sacheonensis TaxID=742054 RepID=A0A7X5BWT6_9BACL|nr:S-layer homology domain-containing protein [Paenibacillus sacheonensis]MBM7567449.1 2',3'-cyclic-nucleotide 2'-phosphodiesterase/3'-nucleotidase/5'-nucleotidase [Paenibacillus sacheonensis]NBC69768.1 hypothetical protein [Paenibacillus sacheonensis]